MIYALFRNAEHAAAIVTVGTNFASFFLSNVGFFSLYLILNGNDQTVKNTTFPTDITSRWNFHASRRRQKRR